MKIRLLTKNRFFNPCWSIQNVISFKRIQLNEIKPIKIGLYNENYLDCLNTKPFNYIGSKYKGFLNKLFYHSYQLFIILISLILLDLDPKVYIAEIILKKLKKNYHKILIKRFYYTVSLDLEKQVALLNIFFRKEKQT